MTEPSEAASYIQDRVEQYRGWYNRRATQSKRIYTALRLANLGFAAAIPIFINFFGATAALLGTVSALLVILSTAVDLFARSRDQWLNYRFTEQYLDREKFLFQTASGIYAGLPPNVAFHHFVERVEWAIAAENSATLVTMTLSPDNRVAGVTARPDRIAEP